MATDRDQPWWADAQEYRHRDTRRRTLDDSRTTRHEDEYSADAARRRRAAAARAAAQQRRSRQDRSPSSRTRRAEPTEFPWIDESPFAPRSTRGETAPSQRSRPGASVTRRPGQRPARRRAAGPIARPEKLLLYIAILGLFLVLAAATNSDAAVLVEHVASSAAR
ncbi:MAG: hypothetical protein ITG02_08080 [Patulibacter sp.]|nr:hypothetical protein [Patulibacter sp.]